MSIRTNFEIALNRLEELKSNDIDTALLNEAVKYKNKTLDEQIKLANKKKQFDFFIKNLPIGKPKDATISFLNKLEGDRIIEFVDKLHDQDSIKPHTINANSLDFDMFDIDAKGIGKGEVYCAWKYKNTFIQGGGESFDVQQGDIRYEVKDYSGSTNAIRVGVEGSVSKFKFWDVILQTVGVVKKIQTGKDTWDLLPAGPNLEKLKELKDYILKRVLEQTKIVTGEFNKTDTEKFIEFYNIANQVVNAYETSGDFNQIVLKGPNQKPKSIIIDPISLNDIPESGNITINIKDSSGNPSAISVINYLKQLEYLRNPSQFQKDLDGAVAEVIEEGQADYWMVFRGGNPIQMKIISKKEAKSFKYQSVSQNGIKFKEP